MTYTIQQINEAWIEFNKCSSIVEARKCKQDGKAYWSGEPCNCFLSNDWRGDDLEVFISFLIDYFKEGK